ncbi:MULTISPECIES: hypothetical protein [Streptomyces]|uniref:hypothetical protein n=1 Tax=Streptomyces TaxID=1883 RepID=UPI000262E188|nr:hypothetical protein [Streptomyces chartreusis]
MAAALRLGTTVAKTAADLWLGGRRRQQERHLSLAELSPTPSSTGWSRIWSTRSGGWTSPAGRP